MPSKKSKLRPRTTKQHKPLISEIPPVDPEKNAEDIDQVRKQIRELTEVGVAGQKEVREALNEFDKITRKLSSPAELQKQINQEADERLNGRRRYEHDPKKENGGNKKKGKCSRIARALVKSPSLNYH